MAPEAGEFQGFTNDQISAFKEAFLVFDKANIGSITSSELGTVMRNLGQNPTDGELRDMVLQIDADGGGDIDFDEFVGMMEKRMRMFIPEETLREAFHVLDKDGNGFLAPIEIRHAMHYLGVDMTLDEAKAMIKEADLDGDGMLNFKEFAAMIS